MTSEDRAPSTGSRHDELAQAFENFTRLAGGMTQEERGGRFDELLTESLRLGGLSPEANRVGRLGEVDVVFTVGEIPFILEATWGAEPVGFDLPAELAARVRRRFEGTLGIFVSMSGYTEPASANLERSGELPRVLLFDGEHVEALVSGRVLPADLIRAALKVASFTGRVHVSLADLLTVVERGGPTFPASPGERAALGLPVRRQATRSRFRRGPKARTGTGLAVLALAVAAAARYWSHPAARIPGPPARSLGDRRASNTA